MSEQLNDRAMESSEANAWVKECRKRGKRRRRRQVMKLRKNADQAILNMLIITSHI